MPRRISRCLCVLFLLFSSLATHAADAPDTSLAPLKFLVGEWKGTDADGRAYKTTYALSSGGTSAATGSGGGCGISSASTGITSGLAAPPGAASPPGGT